MRKLFLPLFCMLFTFPVFAQFKQVAESQIFEENESGLAKILLLKNGSTVFLQTTKRKFEVQIYDAQHKKIVGKEIEPAFFDKRNWNIESVFEINGNIILMVTIYESRTPVLMRVIIDGQNGNLKEEKEIARLDRIGAFAGYAMVFGGVPIPDFFVRKDPKSNYYAVAMLNSFESDRNKRIEIIHFGPDNKEVSHAFYASPDDRYKYMDYIDMAVVGKESVAILVKGYNTRHSGGEESELLLGKLAAGAKTISITSLNFAKDKIVSGGIVRYNSVTDRIIMLAAVKDKRKSEGYTTVLAFVNPATNKIDMTNDIYPEEAGARALDVFGRKNPFIGMPQNIYINDDGSFSVYFETTRIFTNPNRGSYSQLGSIAIANYSILGSPTGSYLMPKNHEIFGTVVFSFYKSEQEEKMVTLNRGNQYKYSAYLDGKKKAYLLFNDIERNGPKVMNGNLTTIQGVGECDAFYYDVSGSEVMPDRQFVFGKPDARRTHNLAVFGVSAYNREDNIFCTLKLEKEKGDKGVKLVWLQPE
jgi:hypothetical protein